MNIRKMHAWYENLHARYQQKAKMYLPSYCLTIGCKIFCILLATSSSLKKKTQI